MRGARGIIAAAAITLATGCYQGRDDDVASSPSAGDDGGTDAGDDAVAESGGSDGGDDANPPAPVEPRCGHDSVAPTRIWRLSDSQHANAIADLLELHEVTAVKTPGTATDSFVNESELLTVTGPMASQYERAASDAAASALGTLSTLLPCSASNPDPSCATAFIDAIVPRAFRRPIDDEERAAFLALFEHGADESFAAGIGMVIEAMLQSPSFLYRTELGHPDAEGPSVSLDAYELASAVSFLLLDSIPDPELWAAAEDGSILEPDTLRAHVERLLLQPRVLDNLVRILTLWLGTPKAVDVSKSAEQYTDFSDALAHDMATEAEHFVARMVESGSVADLLTSRTTFVNERLAAVYGVQGVTGEDFVEVELPAGERAGVMTQLALMSILAAPEETSVVHRGLFVQKLLLCNELPAPPAAVDLDDPEFDGLSQRELVELRASQPDCSSCHNAIDPVGLTFEHYDAIGAYRADVDGTPVDASADVDGVGSFQNAVELMDALATDPRVSRCVSRNLVTYALGRRLGAADVCELQYVFDQVDAANGAIIETFRAVADSEALRLRRKEAN